MWNREECIAFSLKFFRLTLRQQSVATHNWKRTLRRRRSRWRSCGRTSPSDGSTRIQRIKRSKNTGILKLFVYHDGLVMKMLTRRMIIIIIIIVHPTRSGPTDIYEEVLQQKARCNIVLGSKNEMIQVTKSILKEKHYCQIFYSNMKFHYCIVVICKYSNYS